MNWLYIIVMAYIVVSALRGFHKGFLKVVYSMAAWLAAIIFVVAAAPLIGHVLINETPLYDKIEISCEEYVRTQIDKKLEDGTLLDDAVSLPGITWPQELKGMLGQGTKAAVTEALETRGVYHQIAEAVAEICVNIIAFFIALAMILLILWIIGRKLDLFSKTPGIHIINMVLGFFAGVVKAFLVIWLFFALVKWTAVLPFSASLIELIEKNAVLKGLYEQNRLLELLQNLSGSFSFLNKK